jgi:hypothetical protein
MVADCMNADMEAARNLAVGKTMRGQRNGRNLPFSEVLGVATATQPSRHP